MNKVKARNLHNESLVFVRSNVHPDNIRVVNPAIIAIKLANDETKKYNEHGFRRRVPWARTRTLSKLPIVPKRKIRIEKYRFIKEDALFHEATADRSAAEDMNLTFQ